MAKFLSDIVDYLFEQQQVGFNAIDTTALDALILEFIETPQNGYMTETEEEWDDDSTAYITVVVDSTAASITVLEWKELYLEEVYNQSFIQNNQIAIKDHNSPNYPLVDFRDTLFDFDTSTSINYYIGKDSTGDVFIEYEYPVAEKVDGMYFQVGIDGCQYFDTWYASAVGCYIGFSNDGVNWTYICNSVKSSPATPQIAAKITTDKDEAIEYHFYRDKECSEIEPQSVEELMFTDTAIEAKYWRIYFVDLYDSLVAWSVDAGYTGYTAAISHLRFQQIREHGEAVVDKTLPRIKTSGSFAAGTLAASSGNSGAGWFTEATFTTTNIGVKEMASQFVSRISADATCEFRLQFQEHGSAAWVTVDNILFDEDGESMLVDAREPVNPNSDLSITWVYKYRIQTRAPVGNPAMAYRATLMSSFRSSTET